MRMTIEEARAKGFTREIQAIGEFHTLDLLVREEADLDGTFPAFCMDESEMLRVHGWNFNFVEG